MRQVLIIFLTILPIVVTSAQEKQEQNHRSFFHMDVFDYFCYECNFPNATHNFTLNLLLGRTKNQYGFVIGTLGNVIENNAYGVQIAGLGNYVKNQGKGLAVTGGWNRYKSHAGVQIGGFNLAEKMRGLQIGFNNNSVDMQGAQIGFVNISESARIAQFLKGIQIGIINIRESSGFQIGLFNASENNQYPLGLVNIVKDGEMNVGLAYDEIGNTTVQFRSGGQYLYGIVGLGYNVKSSSNHIVAQGGIGAHLNFSSKFRIDTELFAKILTRTYVYFGDNEEEKKRKEDRKNLTLSCLQVILWEFFPLSNCLKK